MHPDAGRRRVIIEGIQPAIDAGRFPIKRTVGEQVVVEADIFTDGHDLLSAVLCYRWARDPVWTEVAMAPLGNDRWQGRFQRVPAWTLLLQYPGLGGPFCHLV